MKQKLFLVLSVSALWSVNSHAMLRSTTTARRLAGVALVQTLGQTIRSDQKSYLMPKKYYSGMYGCDCDEGHVDALGELWKPYKGGIPDACELVVNACKGEGSQDKALMALQYAIALHKDVNEKNAIGFTGLEIIGLHQIYRCRSECAIVDDAVIALLNAGADATSVCFSEGNTLLHEAVAGGHVKLIEPLVKAGIRLDETNAWGEPVLVAAVGYTDASVAGIQKALELKADPNQKDSFGMTPLHKTYQPEVARLLVEGGANLEAVSAAPICGGTPLIRAAYWCRDDVVKELLNLGAKSDARNGKGWTALEIAQQRSLFDKMDQHCIKTVEALQAHEDKQVCKQHKK